MQRIVQQNQKLYAFYRKYIFVHGLIKRTMQNMAVRNKIVKS